MHAVMEMIVPIRLFGRTPSISAAKPANMAILIKFDAIEQLRSFLCRRYHGIGLVCPASAKSETASVGGPLLHIRDARYFLVSSGFTGAAAPRTWPMVTNNSPSTTDKGFTHDFALSDVIASQPASHAARD
jgi:hypothetical protein